MNLMWKEVVMKSRFIRIICMNSGMINSHNQIWNDKFSTFSCFFFFFLLWYLPTVESKQFAKIVLRISYCCFFFIPCPQLFLRECLELDIACVSILHTCPAVYINIVIPTEAWLTELIKLSLAIFVAHPSGGEYFWRFVLRAPDGVQTDQRSFPPGANYSVPFFSFANHFPWQVMDLAELYRNYEMSVI